MVFGCTLYKAQFYRPRDFVFISREDADRLKQIELHFAKFINAVNLELKLVKKEPHEERDRAKAQG